MTLVEILDVVQPSQLGVGVVRGYLDAPRPGSRHRDSSLTVVGWAIARSGLVTAVEIVCSEDVIRRTPLGVSRPDVAATFPEHPSAREAGFSTSLPIAAQARVDLDVRAVLGDRTRIPFARISILRRWHEEDAQPGDALVSVVVTCCGEAAVLAGAIESVLAQTHAQFEVLVVDDDSGDGGADVAYRYPGVKLIRADGEGIVAARNSGLAAAQGGTIVFLEASDRLHPRALEIGLRELRARPDAAFAVGGALVERGGGRADRAVPPLGATDRYLALLRGDVAASESTVVYRRAPLAASGGFDPAFAPLSGYDLRLRLAREGPVHVYPDVVASVAGSPQTADEAAAREVVARSLLKRELSLAGGDARRRRAIEQGRSRQRLVLREQVLAGLDRHGRGRARCLRAAARLLPHDPRGALVALGRACRRRTESSLAVEAWYAAAFLSAHRADLEGRLLHDGTAGPVTTADAPAPVVVTGSLADGPRLETGRFDCVVLGAALARSDDVQRELEAAYRILAPGGVLLAAFPGIALVDGDSCYRFTALSALNTLAESFGRSNVSVECFGNHAAARAALAGLPAARLGPAKLAEVDPAFPVVVGGRGVKEQPSQPVHANEHGG